jgi:exopolyphosphatase/guanosine-5'-triphosphate,3'-diphosphate pyrophosphatase
MPVPKKATPSYLAAIDIGTNSFHLVIVEITASGKIKIVDREKEAVRLGHGPKDMKEISSVAMERGIRVLKRFRRLIDTYKAPVRAVATSAVREALNQKAFVRRARSEARIKVEVVSGTEEARLIYLGVMQALPVYDSRVLLVDIGGGSVEYLNGYKGQPRYATSLKLGCIRLTQQFFRKSDHRPKDVRACRDYVRGFLETSKREMGKMTFDFAIGTSGTIQNIANIIRASRGEILTVGMNNFSFSREELDDVVEKLIAARTPKERLKIDGLDPRRVDIIVAGAIVLQESFRIWKIHRMTISDFALREGIIFDFLKNRLPESPEKHLSNLRYQSVLRLAESFHTDPVHARQTTRLALSLFDQLKNLHGLGTVEREFLEYAALLHEIGFFVGHAQHHRHSYYLIRNAELMGFTDTEKEIIANIARYHRKSHPKAKHEGFSALEVRDQDVVRKLASLLRIADGLDRSHQSFVKILRCTVKRKDVTIRASSSRNIDLEIWAANLKKGLFEEVFRRDVVIRN